MLYEWYSGSDSSLDVPRRLARYGARYDELTQEERIETLSAILELEQDSNWRGYLLYGVAREHQIQDHVEQAVHHFSLALAEFDPLSASFRDVAEQYCGTCYQLICEHFLARDEPERVVELGIAILCQLPHSGLDEFEKNLLLHNLARALGELGHKRSSPWFYQLSLIVQLQAHHVDSEDPGTLEGLLYSYFNVGDAEKCRLVYGLFKEVADDYEHRGRVDEFIATRLHEIE